MLNWQDTNALRAVFDEKKRLQIGSVLPLEKATKLRECVQGLDWRLVLNEGSKHIDISKEMAAYMGATKLRDIRKAAKLRAASEFQYLFENYPLYDLIATECSVPQPITSIFAQFNSDEFLTQIEYITGQRPEFCDMQATRYRAGHMLTDHDDKVAGKNRLFAFVYYLSPVWNEKWGGALEFVAPSGRVIDTIHPVFNSLALFEVPFMHRVTKVKPAAKQPRLALTGWLRTGPGRL